MTLGSATRPSNLCFHHMPTCLLPQTFFNMTKDVPTTTAFEDIYPEDAVRKQKKRWNNLLSKFDKEFSHKADYVSRSPGRVNIIGEVSGLYLC